MEKVKINSYAIYLKSLQGLKSDFLRHVYSDGSFYVSTHKIKGKDLEVYIYDIKKDGEEYYKVFTIPMKNIDYIYEEVVKGNMRYWRKSKFNKKTGLFQEFSKAAEEAV